MTLVPIPTLPLHVTDNDGNALAVENTTAGPVLASPGTTVLFLDDEQRAVALTAAILASRAPSYRVTGPLDAAASPPASAEDVERFAQLRRAVADWRVRAANAGTNDAHLVAATYRVCIEQAQAALDGQLRQVSPEEQARWYAAHQPPAPASAESDLA